MYKIANQVLDAHDDTSLDILRKVAKLNPSINMMTDEERLSLKDNDFALSVITKKASKLNKFPVNNYDSTFLSNQFFNETHQRLPKIAAETAAHNIKVACAIFNVTPTEAVEKLANDRGSNRYFEEDVRIPAREASNKLEKFAQVQQIGDNETFASFTFATPDDVNKGVEYFNGFSEKMPIEYRHKYASVLQRKATEFHMPEIHGQVEKYAGTAYNANVDAHLSSRKSLVNEKLAAAYEKLASYKNTVSPVEFAKLMLGIDKKAGLDRHYGSYLTNPFEATFARLSNPKCLFKTASGDSVTPDNIKKMATDKYAKIKEYFGHSLADALKNDGADIFESLPNDAKEIVVGIADGSL